MSTAPVHQQAMADPVSYVMHIASGVLTTAAMNAALQCRIADQLAAGPKPISELARTAQVHEEALYRCLRALAMIGIFTETSKRTFANTPASEAMRTDHPSKIHDTLLWISDALHFRAYAEFMHSVRTGETCFEKACGLPIFEYFPTDPVSNREFNNAMTSMSAMIIPPVLGTYDFSGLGTLCDVAGGHGMILTSILQKHQDLRGILFDLEHVVHGAKERIAAAGLTDRCTTATGDFFKAVPEANSYIMKHIIHDWDEERVNLILRNCLKAMQGNGKILLLEAVLPEGDTPHMGKWMDLEMLALPGGRERTAVEYEELLRNAGLKINRIVPNPSPIWVIEAVRA